MIDSIRHATVVEDTFALTEFAIRPVGFREAIAGAIQSGGDWRVEALEPGRRVRLAAEMKLPGRAWLEFEVTADSSGSRIRQTATFDPVGLLGRAC